MSKNVLRFATYAALLLLAVSCLKDPEYGPAKIGISKESLEFSSEAGEEQIKILSNRDWTAEIVSNEESTDWLTVSESSGTPSEDSVALTITVLPNSDEDRYATVNFRTETVYSSLRVFQKGARQKEYTPISQVRELYQGENVTITEDWTIKGTVISNYRNSEYGGLNNATSAKTMVVSDGEAGISLYLTENNTVYGVGDVLEIKLKGLELQRYNNGSLQVNALPLTNLTLLTNAPVDPVTISAADLVSGAYESMYVAVENVQVADADKGKTFVQNEKHTSINFISRTGENFVLFSSSYSTFGAETVPTGSGVLKGIAMVYGSTYQISVTSESDYAGLTGERFDGGDIPTEGKVIGDYNTWKSVGPVTSFLDEFHSVTSGNAEYLNDNWLFYTSDGSNVNTGWKTGVYNEDKYIQVAPYSSASDQVVAFALIPALNVAAAATKDFSFRKALYYKEADASKMEVVVSKNFTGDFTAATWEVVKDVTFPDGAEMNTWVEENISLAAYSSETSLCVALRYTGKANTYRIDDVKFADGVAAPYFEITPLSKTLSADAGSFTISVNSNVEWSVSSDNSAFVPAVTSGNGTAEITVNYTANNSETENRSATITVSTTDPEISEKELACEVTQKSKSASAGGEYDSNVDITSQVSSGVKAYEADVVVGGTTYKGLKLGTSSVGGSYTTTALPHQGDRSLSLYAVAWNGKSCALTITVNGGGTIDGKSSVTVDLVANAGANNNSPFTIEFGENDFYTFSLKGITASSTLTFSTPDSAPRGILLGVNMK